MVKILFSNKFVIKEISSTVCCIYRTGRQYTWLAEKKIYNKSIHFEQLHLLNL